MENLERTREVRKLQLTGGATYTVSLPKRWVQAQGLGAREGIRVEWRPSGALRLTPLDASKEPSRIVVLKRAEIPQDALYDHLMAAYLSGADTIRLDSEIEIGRSDRTVIRHFLRSTRGFEFGDESLNSLTLICLLSSGELQISSSLNQMYLQLSSLVRDILAVLLGGPLELIEDHNEREREVDALLHLIDRQVGAMLDSHDVAESLGLNRRQAVEYSNLARTFERMMDHADQMAVLVLAAESRPEMNLEEAPLSLLPDWLNVMRTLMIQLRVRDPVEIERARNILKQAQISLAAHEEELWTEQRKRVSLLFDSRCSESIRRLCAYARDFGEILLNILVYDGSMSEPD